MKISKKSVFAVIDGRKVGTLAQMKNGLVAFSYDEGWLNDGFSLNPYSLPLERGVRIPDSYDPFDGLFGIFSDSLPDGWGRLLVDRMLVRHGFDPFTLNSLDRLSIVGSSGMGALEYIPAEGFEEEFDTGNLDELAEECSKILASGDSSDLDRLFALGGSSGGARPKSFIDIDGDKWIVKFPSSVDGPSIGRQEAEYMAAASLCGIEVPEFRLLPSKKTDGYFAVKRFDRIGERRIHMVTAGGLLEASHRLPVLDYTMLMKLTLGLTHSYAECRRLYRLMCFNVFAHNRDDHAKNFSYLIDPASRKWKLSPAYDITWSVSMGGEHATSVHGNGRNPGVWELVAVGSEVGLDKDFCLETAESISKTVNEQLSEWLQMKR